MSNGGFAVTNMAAAGTVSVSGSFDSTNFPSSCLTDYQPKPVWKASAKTSVWLKVDLGAAQSVKLVALLNHNLTSGATVTLEANASDSWGSPSYSQSLTWRSTHIFLVLNQSYRWWRVTISDSGNTYYPSIGEWFIGSLTTFTMNYDWPGRSKSYINRQHETDGGMRFGFNIASRRGFDLGWTYADAATFAEIQSLHDSTYDGVLPLLFLPDTAGTELLYCKLDGALAYKEAFNSYSADVRQTLVELPNGVTL